jgi:hypothetical protein
MSQARMIGDVRGVGLLKGSSSSPTASEAALRPGARVSIS